jgi:predicted alternative tryptophan synthase beta-subunit
MHALGSVLNHVLLHQTIIGAQGLAGFYAVGFSKRQHGIMLQEPEKC